ncbi:MAG: L-threonylcarbamoyladenylate synthase [Bellilinea sp.]|nr:L-threonylcarbamoyladenylate synthase [Bellilinea sp.]
MTEILKVNPLQPEPDVIQRAAQVLQAGGLVAFPTETVYGLGANALDSQAVQRIFLAKGRPANDPLIVHVQNQTWLERVVNAHPPQTELLVNRFWPGPLTLIFPRKTTIPLNVTAGGESVAVRAPSHPVAQALLAASGLPIAAPSANRFGHTSPTQARHVLDDLAGRVDLILDGGECPIGLESTVLDLTKDPPVILRPGGIPREEIEQVIGRVRLANKNTDSDEAPRSPGMLERHYSPHATLILIETTGNQREDTIKKIRDYIFQAQKDNLKPIGVLTVDEEANHYVIFSNVEIISLGSLNNLAEIGRNLFAGMRTLEQAGVEIILTTDFGEEGLGLAIRDRLRRAASQIIRS